MRWFAAWLVSSVAIVALLPGNAGTAPAGARLDQFHAGNPDCTSANFRGFVSSTGSLSQEFVPAQAGLVAVELCLSLGDPVTDVTVNIRAGRVASPSTVVATGTVRGLGPGLQWVRVQMATQVQLVPGETYLIEIPDSTYFGWYGTCGTVIGSCTTVDPDTYSAGVASYSTMRDFGFRTYAGLSPALVELRTLPLLAADGVK